MSVGKQLLFTVLTADPAPLRLEYLTRLSDAQVTEAMFPAEDEQQAYRYMTEYRVRYGTCPSLALVEVETGIRFPQYVAQEPFDFWLDEFREFVKHTELIDLVSRVEWLLAEGRVNGALDQIGETHIRLRDLLRERKSCMTLAEVGEAALERHRLVQTGMLMDGVHTGIPYLDAVTGGVQPGDLWVLAGESGTGKTYILCRCAMSAVASGRKSLMVSMEMPNLQVGRRSLALGAQVSANNFRLGRLSHFAVEQIREFLRTWDTAQNDRMILVEGRVNYSVREVRAVILEHRPDVVFVDGAYMLRSGKKEGAARWEVNMEVMEILKQIAMEENIGIVASFQFDQKQKTKGLSTIMGGQAVGQLASVVIGIENDDSSSHFDPVTYKELTLYKGREGERGKIRLRYDMSRTIIEQDRVLSGSEDPGREAPEPDLPDDDM